MAIIKSCGNDLPTMLATFGTPIDLVATRGSEPKMDRVLCDYGTFILGFRNEKIVDCFFRKTWKGGILGIKIGDTHDEVAKIYGAPDETYKNKDGVIIAYGYNRKDLGVSLYPNFDAETGKLTRVEVNPLE